MPTPREPEASEAIRNGLMSSRLSDSEYENARDELDVLLAALAFYADSSNYVNETPRHVRPVITDGGAIARKALGMSTRPADTTTRSQKDSRKSLQSRMDGGAQRYETALMQVLDSVDLADAKIYARRAISEAHFGPVDERGGSA